MCGKTLKEFFKISLVLWKSHWEEGLLKPFDLTTAIHTSALGISSAWLLGGRDLIKGIFFP